jgi:hypothetical protein
VRCGQCDDVLMVVVEEPDSICLELRGMSWLRVPRQLPTWRGLSG